MLLSFYGSRHVLLLQKFDANLAISNYFSIPLISRLRGSTVFQLLTYRLQNPEILFQSGLTPIEKHTPAHTGEPRYVVLSYLEHPTISNCFSLPLAQINPGYLELYYIPKKHWSKSVSKCSQGTSWQDVLKAEKCIDVLTVTKAKLDWLDLPLRMHKATSCRYLLILGIKLLLQKFDANLAISNPRYLEPLLSRTVSRNPWNFETAWFYCSFLDCSVTSNSPAVLQDRTNTVVCEEYFAMSTLINKITIHSTWWQQSHIYH